MQVLTSNRIPWPSLTQALHGAQVYQLTIGRGFKVAHLVIMSSADPAAKYAVLVRPLSRQDIDIKIRRWVMEILAADYGPEVEFRPIHVAEEGHTWEPCNEPTWVRQDLDCTKLPAGRIFVTSYDVEQGLWAH